MGNRTLRVAVGVALCFAVPASCCVVAAVIWTPPREPVVQMIAPPAPVDPDVQLAEWMATEGNARIERLQAARVPLDHCARPAQSDEDPRECIPRRMLDCEVAMRLALADGVPDAVQPLLEDERDRNASTVCYARAALVAFQREPALVARLRRSGNSVEEWGAEHGGAARIARDAINACPDGPMTATIDDWLNPRFCCFMYRVRVGAGHCTLDRLAAMHSAGLWPPPRRGSPECAGAPP